MNLQGIADRFSGALNEPLRPQDDKLQGNGDKGENIL